VLADGALRADGAEEVPLRASHCRRNAAHVGDAGHPRQRLALARAMGSCVRGRVALAAAALQQQLALARAMGSCVRGCVALAAAALHAAPAVRARCSRCVCRDDSDRLHGLLGRGDSAAAAALQCIECGITSESIVFARSKTTDWPWMLPAHGAQRPNGCG
jgi:hypothetical protein